MQLFGACLPIPHFHAHRTRSILLSNQILIQCVHTMHFLPSTRSNSHRPPVFSLLHALWMLAPSSQLSSFRFKYKLISSSPSANTPFFFSLLKHLSSLFFSWHQLIVLVNLQRPCAWWMRRDTWARNSSRPSSRRDTQFTRQFKTMVRYVCIYIYTMSLHTSCLFFSAHVYMRNLRSSYSCHLDAFLRREDSALQSSSFSFSSRLGN